MDNNWIVENLTNAFGVWTNKMTEMWSLLTESPQTFKGGTIWQTTEQLTNLNSHRPSISPVIGGYKQSSKSAQSIEITEFIEKSKPSQIIFLYTLLPLTA